MKTLLNALLRAIAHVAASESGELLSVRGKANLLRTQMNSGLGAKTAPKIRTAA